nr:nuclear pore complex protein NUP1-like [Tanacetum cinerariifolium]
MGFENGFKIPRSRGRWATYNIARTSYPRSPSTFTQKALKRRISILEHDIGLVSPLRRIRQKANLLTLRDIRERGYTALQQPDHASRKKLLLMNASEPNIIKGAEQNRDTSMHGSGSVSGYTNVPTKSTQTATKILQHVEKMDLKEKSSGLIKSPTKQTLDMLHGQAVRSLEKRDSSDSALAADIVATSTLPGVSRTPALVKPHQKKCAFQMSAPEDDSFEIDDALAADIVATSTLPGVSRTPALVKNNKQMFSGVVKVLSRLSPKNLKSLYLLRKLMLDLVVLAERVSLSAFSVNGPSDSKPSASSDPKALESTRMLLHRSFPPTDAMVVRLVSRTVVMVMVMVMRDMNEFGY